MSGGGAENRSDTNSQLAKALAARLRGDVRFDALSRAIYATDGSIYEIVPLGVVKPQDVADVIATVEECRKTGTSIVARGAGTGLTGGAIGVGVQMDMSRYMNRIGEFDPQARTIEVEPGVVLDELNAHLAPYRLQFAPDVATSSRATLGGMIANNSCGAHSIIHGRTVDHVISLTVVLADGQVAVFGDPANPPSPEPAGQVDRAACLGQELAELRDRCYDEIQSRFPEIMRSNGGYGLDRLGPRSAPVDAVKVLCGSEGTLGIVVNAKLKLTAIPRHTGLVVLHFDDVLKALWVTPEVLKHNPAAVELIDRLILEAGKTSPALGKRCDFLQGDPSAILVVEFQGAAAKDVASAIDVLLTDNSISKTVFAASKVLDKDRQVEVWNLRKAGLGLLMSQPGDRQPYAFVEDSAVAPERLSEYIERFHAILAKEGVEAGCYAHAGAGCIHVRPVLNLKQAGDVERMYRIADQASDLALEFGGTMTGEHGDGLLRSCWLEKMYGKKIILAFKEVKRLFDPENLFNPHKIVDPWPMTEHLRFGPSFASESVKTYLDFSAHTGMDGLAQMCSGVGQCRQRLVGVMCPSYMATGDELHTTRARANALRIALSNRDLLDGLDDPQLAEVMELCISCKACKSECPTGVDMARLKAEYLAHRHLAHGVTARARMVAEMPHRLKLASRFPKLTNLISGSKLIRAMMERRYGLDRRIPPPRLAGKTFRSWFRRHRKKRGDARAPRGRVVYFVDTWTDYFKPQVGIAAVKLLERAGFEVLCPRTLCCGRPAISQGLLADAKQLAEYNIRRLAYTASQGVPIVGTEPSCILTLVDEYPQLVRSQAARNVAKQAMMIETFLHRLLTDDPDALGFSAPPTPLLYHAHCHQKAIVGSGDAVALLGQICGDLASEIDSGCCGMAGAFGHEVEHYDVARTMGEQRLFPAIRARGHADILISGFSCSQHIEHHTDARTRHIVEQLADLLI